MYFTNSDAKYYGKRESTKEDKVTYLPVSEYSSLVPDIAKKI